MTPVERNVLPARGPSFFRQGDEIWFQFVVDPTNIIGPRVATRADQAKHEGAWQEFCRSEDVSPLDRDADGADGGSLPVEPPLPPLATIDAAPDPVRDAIVPVLEADFEEMISKPAEEEVNPGPASAEQAPEVSGEVGTPAEPRVKRKYTRRTL